MLLAGVDEAEAALKTVTFEKLVAAKGAGPVRDRDLPLVVGRVNKGPGPVSHTTRFQVYTNILSVTAAWVVGTDFRLIGVDTDLVDNNDNVVASDNSTGLLSGFATSTLTASGLSPGKFYKLRLIGTAQATAAYPITVTPGNAP